MAAKLESRPYQTRIVTKAMDAFTKENARSALIHSPTGSGKTVIAFMLLDELRQSGLFPKRKKVTIGWAAMRRNLLTQAAEELERWGYDFEIVFLSMFDKNPPKVDVLVVDEAQHDATMSMGHLHGQCSPTSVIGLSATPWRADRVGLCFDKIIRDAGIADLIRQGYLSEYHHYTMPEYTPDTVAQTYLSDPKKWGKSVVFFHKESDCLEVVAKLKAGGIATDLVTCNTDRDTQLELFAKGKTKVLVNMMILTEGFDSPSLKTVFVRPSVKSCTMQMGGRVFRIHDGCPHKQIVQCARTETPFVKIAPAKQQFIQVNGEWVNLQPSSEVEKIIAANRALIAKTETTYNPALFKKRKRAEMAFKDEGDDE